MHVDSNVWLPIMVVVLTFIVSHIISGKKMREATRSGNWYDKINKSSFEPPKFVYSIVWIFLYIFLAAVWANSNYILSPNGTLDNPNFQNYIFLNYAFVALMVINICWSYIFFSDKNFVLSFLILIISLLFILPIIYILSNPMFPSWMMMLMIVYLIWILFAIYLNYYVTRNNISLVRKKNLSYIFV